MKRALCIMLICTLVFTSVLLSYVPRSHAFPILAPLVIEKAISALVAGITIGVGLWLAPKTPMYDELNARLESEATKVAPLAPENVKADVELAVQRAIENSQKYIDVPDSLVAWANSYVQSRIIASIVAGMELKDTGQGIIPFTPNNNYDPYYAPLAGTTMLAYWETKGMRLNEPFVSIRTPVSVGTNYTGTDITHVFMDESLNGYAGLNVYQSGNTNPNRFGIEAYGQLAISSATATSAYVFSLEGSNLSKFQTKEYNIPFVEVPIPRNVTRGNDILNFISQIMGLAGVTTLKAIPFEDWMEIQRKKAKNELTTPRVDKVHIPMVLTPTGTGAIDVAIPIPRVVLDAKNEPKVAVPMDGGLDWAGPLADPITGEKVKEGTDVGNPPIEGNPPLEWDTTPYVPPTDAKRWSNLVTTRFPFSLPWDVYHLVSLIAVPAERPNINLNQKVAGMDFKMNYDFAFMESYIGYFRTFVVIAFVLGLILATRRLLGGAS